LEDLSPEILALARGPVGPPSRRDIQVAHVSDAVVGDVPVRIYQPAAPVGVVVYFHGGGFVMGSIGMMDTVARSLADSARAVVNSVGYRLAPEHPYPAGLGDCEAVTRWAVANAGRFGVSPRLVAVAGESAGGNLAAAVSLRTRDMSDDLVLAGQVLIYPGIAGTEMFPSSRQFDGLVISQAACEASWQTYSQGRELESDPYAVPLKAKSLSGLPPALVVLGGCDMLRDEGRAYAQRLRDAGVDVEEVTFDGQPHGFINFDLPSAAIDAFDRIGSWLQGALAHMR
jgi:acetyl esterase